MTLYETVYIGGWYRVRNKNTGQIFGPCWTAPHLAAQAATDAQKLHDASGHPEPSIIYEARHGADPLYCANVYLADLAPRYLQLYGLKDIDHASRLMALTACLNLPFSMVDVPLLQNTARRKLHDIRRATDTRRAAKRRANHARRYPHD